MAELLHSEAESYSSSENKLWESDSDWCSTSSSSTTCADEMEWFDDIMDSDSYDSDTSYSSQESISQQQKINMADIENASDHHNCKVDYNMEDETSKCKELNNSSESLSQHSGNITDSTTTDVKQSPDDHLEKCSLAAHTSIKRKRLSCPVKGCNAKTPSQIEPALTAVPQHHKQSQADQNTTEGTQGYEFESICFLLLHKIPHNI